METVSRVKNSFRNTINGLLSQFISMGMNFIVRTYFIIYLNEAYLGVNGLFSNVLTVLSLVELGFGPSMIYSMYKPLAEKNIPKLQALMSLYRKVYVIVGCTVALLGTSILPFMDYFIKDKPNVENLTFIYVMFLADSVCSYFFAYNRSILSADQKEYICSQYRYIFTTIKAVFQIIILVITRNFILYLAIQILTTFTENIFVTYRVYKIYPFLKNKCRGKLLREEVRRIVNDVKALTLSKFGYVILNGTDNIIISAFVGVEWVGRLSNYSLITGSIVMILSQISSGITASVGNFIAKEEKEKQYALFKIIELANFWIYGFSAVCIIILINPLIRLWIGDSYILSQPTVIVIAANFFISGIMSFYWMFRSTMGLFVQGKYRPVIVALLNLVLSIILVKYFGLIGVLLGTTISRLAVNFWYDPLIIFKYGLKKSPLEYFLKCLYRILVLTLTAFLLYCIYELLIPNEVTIQKFVLMAAICIALPNTAFFVSYSDTPELKYLFNVSIKSIISRKYDTDSMKGRVL